MKFNTHIHIVLLLVTFSYLPTFAQFTTNGGSSDFTNDAAWTGGTAPNMTFWDGSNDADVSHDLTYTGSITISSGNVLTIKSGATLTITGTLNMGNIGGVVIEAGGTIIANAVFYQSNANSFTNAGTLNITTTFTNGTSGIFSSTGTLTTGGNFTISSGADVDLSGTNTIGGALSATGSGTDFDFNGGTLDVTSNVTFSGDGNITVAGDMDVGGDMDVTGSGGASISLAGTLDVTSGTLTVDNNGFINGTGVLGWGTLSANPSCSGAIITCSGTATSVDNNVGGGCGGSYGDPAGTPLDLNTCAVGTLPIELLSFTVIKSKDADILHWVTGMELNNNYFEILGSENGIDWSILIVIPGAGNSNQILNYTERITSLHKYYKLRQTDFDGTSEDSKIIRVNRNVKNTPFISSNDNLVTVTYGAGLEIQIFDVGGSVVKNGTINDDFFTVNNSELRAGVYIVRVGTTNTKIFVK